MSANSRPIRTRGVRSLMARASAKLPARPADRAGLYAGAEKFIPSNRRLSLTQLRTAAAACRGCDLYLNATQTVFGRGPARARCMIVGEVPGDQEDVQGRPFVGPAGRLLREALAEAGIAPDDVYMTNVVKHFKWTPAPRGKRRLHAKPSIGEVRACMPWLEREVRLVKPSVMILLGATAAQAVLGPTFKVTRERGKVLTETTWAPSVIATVHPSSILRAPEDVDRKALYREFVADLRPASQTDRQETTSRSRSHARPTR